MRIDHGHGNAKLVTAPFSPLKKGAVTNLAIRFIL
jgi:hypothetical protein